MYIAMSIMVLCSVAEYEIDHMNAFPYQRRELEFFIASLTPKDPSTKHARQATKHISSVLSTQVIKRIDAARI